MKITKISLTNFRSFGRTQCIDLAPVTLLFGPNSVGKSSVLMSLAYVQQILKKGHCNPQKLDALGNKKVGGFYALVHRKDLKKTIKIKIDFEPNRTPFVYYGSEVDEMANVIQHVPYVLMNDFGGRTESGAVELEIAWSGRNKTAFVKNYRVSINGEYVGCITSSEDGRNSVIRELNTMHPLLVPYNNDDWLNAEYGEGSEREPLEQNDYHTEFEKVLNGLNPNPRNTAAVADVENSKKEFFNRIAPISLACSAGAIPFLGRSVITNLIGQGFEEEDNHFNYLVVRQVLSQAFVLPLDKLLEYLERSIQIGPLRLVPESDYAPNPHPEQADWVNGSAAWDLIHKNPGSNDNTKKVIENVSDWFASVDKIDAGYQIINQSIAEAAELSASDAGELLTKRHVFFKELRSGVMLSANQLGTGISQVLPIVVAANIDGISLIAIEQPELHIHPRFQVELADVFLNARDEHSFLIETHSEHIILRLLRRIRQDSENELPEGYKSIKEDDVSIVYLDPSEEGVVVKRIRINSEGEFVDRWPQGFFVERREELL